MSDQEAPRPSADDPAPSEPAYPPEARWWTGLARGPNFDQLLGQAPPGVLGRVIECRVRRSGEGDDYAIEVAYVPDPPEA